MSYRPHMTGAMVFVIVIMFTSISACTSPQDSSVPYNSSQPKAVQSGTEAGTKAGNNQSHAGSIIFRGICDGSAAVRLGDGTILVAYDELNTLFAYTASGGIPTARIGLNALLELKTHDEIDLEAATVYGDRIWWVGSHSLDRKGVHAPNRHMLFATNVPSADLSDLKLLSEPLDLTSVLLKSIKMANVLTEKTRSRLPKQGGLNIEGLATGNDGSILVGFRSPLSVAGGTSGNALVVSLLPTENTFEVQKLSELDLDNRGIRDIVNDGAGYIIIAGPVATEGKFSLYSWNGNDSPQNIISLEGLNAEGIISLDRQLLILSDDGKVKRNDGEAKDGMRMCDSIRRKNSLGENHPGVFFRAKIIPKQ